MLRWLLGGFVALFSTIALSQGFPERPVRIIVPLTPGGSPDTIARALAQGLQGVWPQPVVVENRTGGSQNIGSDLVAKSPPDGYTWLLAPDNVFSVNPHIGKQPFDPLADLLPVTQVARIQFLLVVNPDVPAKSVQELVALAKAKPGELNFGSSGNGSPQHLGATMFQLLTGTKMNHVPYKGAAPAIADLLPGRIQVWIGAANTHPAARQGRKASPARRHADHRANRSRLFARSVARSVRAGQDAARHRDEDPRRGGQDPEQPGSQGQARSAGDRAGHQFPGRVRTLHPRGQPEVGQAHQRSRHQGGLTWPTESPSSCCFLNKSIWGSDAIAAMLRALDIPYLALNPGASYRGLHDSIVNYLGNTRPQMLLCLHEEAAVAIAHGYAKASGRMMGVVLHSNVGLMHGSMAIFNAWCDRVPMLILGATGPWDAAKRRPWIDWIHTSRRPGCPGARLHQVGQPAGFRSRRLRSTAARGADRRHRAARPNLRQPRCRASGSEDRRAAAAYPTWARYQRAGAGCPDQEADRRRQHSCCQRQETR